MDKRAKRAGIAVLIALGVVGTIIWMLGGQHPIFFYGEAAVLWLLWLMTKGIVSRPFRPRTDDGRSIELPKTSA